MGRQDSESETPRQTALKALAVSHGLPQNPRMSPLDRISVDPNIRFGKPCVRVTRITVGDVLGYLVGGISEADLLADFPQLTQDDIRACLTYAAERER